MLRKKLFRILIALAVLVALLLPLKVYVVRTDSGGALLWNADKAYFFIGMANRGYRLSYLGYLVEALREMFPFGATSPTDNHFSVLVLHVTADSVQHYSIDNFWLGGDPEPFQGELYAWNMLPGGALMKWSGTHFESVSFDEQARMQKALRSGVVPPGPSYDNAEGWSKRTVGGDVIRESPTVYIEKDARVTIEVDGKELTFVMNSGYVSHEAYIDLIRPGQQPERIWQLDEQPHRVSRAAYDHMFKKQ